ASAKSRGGGRDNGPKAVSVRDHRTPKVVTVRDHREPKVVNVRDHRTTKTDSVRQEKPKFIWVEKKGQSGHWERARPEGKSTPVVRDHRKPETPTVRDHRKVQQQYQGGVKVTSTPRPKKAAPPPPMYNHSMSMGGR